MSRNCHPFQVENKFEPKKTDVQALREKSLCGHNAITIDELIGLLKLR